MTSKEEKSQSELFESVLPSSIKRRLGHSCEPDVINALSPVILDVLDENNAAVSLGLDELLTQHIRFYIYGTKT